ATRPLTLVAVGGGSVGDAVGFLASVLWRGVDLWHVPTTLLAMVDSAHGGKTAVNLGHAKNQLGTFHAASCIAIVREILGALPHAHREEGLAELIKGLWLDDAEALDILDAAGGTAALATGPFADVGDALFALLERAVAVKYRIVARDPKETKGVRTFLNFGHTVAHALELAFGMSHGAAVAWGMAAAAEVSRDLGMDRVHAERLLDHVEPLLGPMSGFTERLPFERFEALVARDKKRIGGALRSVVLDAPGAPRVTREVSPTQWYDAVLCAERRWRTGSFELPHTEPASITGALEVEASKSELNRALTIAHLRPGATDVVGTSRADDVVFMRRALEHLAGLSDEDATIHVGLGGTTLRFLLAVCAARPAKTHLVAGARLMERPHGPLIDALRAFGATIEQVEGERLGFVVHGTASRAPRTLTVPVHESSQYASALAMLSATGTPVTIRLSTGGARGYEDALVASRPYLELTLSMLEDAGVHARWNHGALICEPTLSLEGAVTLRANADESSAAVWRAAQFLGAGLVLEGIPPVERSRHADRALVGILEQLAGAAKDEVVQIDLRESPDLAPVLTALAIQVLPAVELVGGAHLKHKESDRIGDLVRAFAAIGVDVTGRDDGLFIPAGLQAPSPDASPWPTFEDHRLAMAGLLVSFAGPITIAHPMVVTKSYPDFWRHARRLGWSVRRSSESDAR
ncbi:MAG: hypothetical protein AAGI01_15165, partial [Myxococcota bacterium]